MVCDTEDNTGFREWEKGESMQPKQLWVPGGGCGLRVSACSGTRAWAHSLQMS